MPCAIERSRWIEQSRHWRMTERLIHHYVTFGGPSGPPKVAPDKLRPQAGCGMRLAMDLRDENPTNDPAAYFPS